MSETEGFAAVPNWMIRDLSADELSIYGLAVYMALASHSGKGGIRPSIATLAKEARCSPNKVREELGKLTALGVVKVIRRVKAKGLNDTNVYTLRPNGPARGTAPREVPLPHPVQEGTAPGGPEEEPLKKNPSRNTPVVPSRVDAAFEQVWSVWPTARRGARKKSESSFRTAARTVGAEKLDRLVSVAGMFCERWASWPADDVKYVPLLSTWLNQERWTTPLPEVRVGKRSTMDTARDADAILRARREQREGQLQVTA